VLSIGIVNDIVMVNKSFSKDIEMTMLNYMEPNYEYIAIFTNLDRGDVLRKKRDMALSKEGFTCCWKISATRKIEKILLYIRENNVNKIYHADYYDREIMTDDSNRFKLYFKNLQFIENTNSNWKEFVNTQSPVRYMKK
jgi:hypothetical protein